MPAPARRRDIRGPAPLLFPVFDLGMRVPCHRMADAAKPIGAGGLQSLQHGRHPVCELQIGIADDRRCRPARAVEPGGAGCCQALHELDLADRAQLTGPSGRYIDRASIKTVERTL